MKPTTHTPEDFLDYVIHPENWVAIATCPYCLKETSLDHNARDIKNDLKFVCKCGRTVFFEELRNTRHERTAIYHAIKE